MNGRALHASVRLLHCAEHILSALRMAQQKGCKRGMAHVGGDVLLVTLLVCYELVCTVQAQSCCSNASVRGGMNSNDSDGGVLVASSGGRPVDSGPRRQLCKIVSVSMPAVRFI